MKTQIRAAPMKAGLSEGSAGLFSWVVDHMRGFLQRRRVGRSG
ncbi:hypothetical protein [Roseateles chitinivorans]|nr:hypothetical protein [Roseateles chitinivorans]